MSVRLDLDTHVACIDGAFGDLADVIIDPGTRRVTHLIVQRHERPDLARLVPIGRARTAEGSDSGLSLDCTIAEIDALDPVQRSEYVRLGEPPSEDPGWDHGIEQAAPDMLLYGSLGADSLGAGMEPMAMDPHTTLRYDRIPKGTVEIRRASDVTSSDGHHLGQVVGVIVDERNQIMRLVLEHGHLWGKHQIEIPIGSIDRIESDEVVLTVSKEEVVG